MPLQLKLFRVGLPVLLALLAGCGPAAPPSPKQTPVPADNAATIEAASDSTERPERTEVTATLTVPRHKQDQPAAAAPNTDVSLDDLSADVVPLLRQLPHVVSVERHGPTGLRPTHRIVHLTDWHFVPRDDYAADLRSLADEPLSDEEIDRLHAELLDEVELVQQQQLDLLRVLIREHGLQRIHVEGLTAPDQMLFERKIAALRVLGQQIEKYKGEMDAQFGDEAPPETRRQLQTAYATLDAAYRRDLLQLGAAGRLVLTEEIEGVLPSEDAAAYAAAHPVGEDGTVTLDQGKIAARQDGLVKLLLGHGPLALIVLGGGHDLSGSVERLSGGKAEYIRVEQAAWREFAAPIE